MHRSYNSDEKGIVSGQRTYVAYRTVSENTGNNIVRGEKKSLKILLKILFNILFKIFLNMSILMQKLFPRWINQKGRSEVLTRTEELAQSWKQKTSLTILREKKVVSGGFSADFSYLFHRIVRALIFLSFFAERETFFQAVNTRQGNQMLGAYTWLCWLPLSTSLHASRPPPTMPFLPRL